MGKKRMDRPFKECVFYPGEVKKGGSPGENKLLSCISIKRQITLEKEFSIKRVEGNEVRAKKGDNFKRGCLKRTV